MEIKNEAHRDYMTEVAALVRGFRGKSHRMDKVIAAYTQNDNPVDIKIALETAEEDFAIQMGDYTEAESRLVEGLDAALKAYQTEWQGFNEDDIQFSRYGGIGLIPKVGAGIGGLALMLTAAVMIMKSYVPPTQAVPPGEPVKPATVPSDIYTVESGDNLTKIAKAHGLTLEELLRLNPDIANPNLIRPGQAINVGE